MLGPPIEFDVFLSHSHCDAAIVSRIAQILEDEHHFKVWLDKWILIPGEPFRQAMAKGLDTAKTCAVFVGAQTPKGWFEEEITKALNRQTKDKSFRVIPVLLPGSNPEFITDFLDLRTWVEFKNGIDKNRPMHELACGITGISPGRLYEENGTLSHIDEIEEKLKRINHLHDNKLIETSIMLEFQRMILNEFLSDKRK